MDRKVKVGLRVRPFLSQSSIADLAVTVSEDEASTLVSASNSPDQFDSVFNESHRNTEVYNTMGKPLVDHFFNGCNVTFMAYGQTGSGKTHTMGTSDMSNGGILPSVLADIFTRKDVLVSAGVNVSTELSCVELHNENFRDLLSPKGSGKIELKDNAARETMIFGLSSFELLNYRDAGKYLLHAAKSRVVGSHGMNANSSRSHVIYIITLRRFVSIGNTLTEAGFINQSLGALLQVIGEVHKKQEKETREVGQGSKRKCAVAFEETTDQTSHNHDILTSAILTSNSRAPPPTPARSTLCTSGTPAASILKLKKTHGLSTPATARKAKPSATPGTSVKAPAAVTNYIPYRNSNLTRLLRDSFGGNGLTVLIVCISADPSCAASTKQSLEFAKTAAGIVNKPHVPMRHLNSAVGTSLPSASSAVQVGAPAELTAVTEALQATKSLLVASKAQVECLRAEMDALRKTACIGEADSTTAHTTVSSTVVVGSTSAAASHDVACSPLLVDVKPVCCDVACSPLSFSNGVVGEVPAVCGGFAGLFSAGHVNANANASDPSGGDAGMFEPNASAFDSSDQWTAFESAPSGFPFGCDGGGVNTEVRPALTVNGASSISSVSCAHQTKEVVDLTADSVPNSQASVSVSVVDVTSDCNDSSFVSTASTADPNLQYIFDYHSSSSVSEKDDDSDDGDDNAWLPTSRTPSHKRRKPNRITAGKDSRARVEMVHRLTAATQQPADEQQQLMNTNFLGAKLRDLERIQNPDPVVLHWTRVMMENSGSQESHHHAYSSRFEYAFMYCMIRVPTNHASIFFQEPTVGRLFGVTQQQQCLWGKVQSVRWNPALKGLFDTAEYKRHEKKFEEYLQRKGLSSSDPAFDFKAWYHECRETLPFIGVI